MASLKQATYLRDSSPDDTEATIYYIDLRTPGKYEDFLRRLEEDEKVSLVKGKVAKIEEDAATGDPVVTVEDILGGGKINKQFDMVVLASGMEPAAKGAGIPDDVTTSVQDATRAALKSMQTSVKSPAGAVEMAGGN
jgi:quinone-modifying oxidoreductase subunit QmoA